jgi:hypothetical protein
MEQPLRKFEEVLEVPSNYLIKTPQGFKNINKVMKTIPYEVWHIKLVNGDELKAADTHILYTVDHTPIYLQDIHIGTPIETDVGYFACNYISNLGYEENMYDVEVDSEEHEFYSNGFVSHNTTTSCIYLLWSAIFNEHCNIAVLANKQKNAIEILDDIRKAYEGLPAFMKPGVTEYNNTKIEFENGSAIFGAATSENALRGFSAKILFCDEFAFVPKNIADKFWKSNFPIIGNKGQVILVSTPNGPAGLFYEIWQSANKQDGTYPFAPFKVEWWEVPGRDEKFKQDTIAALGSLQSWLQEYECKFEGSSKTLLSGAALDSVGKAIKNPIKQESQWLNIWSHPQKGRVYVEGLDVSSGSGSDNSVAAIYDVTDLYTKGYYELAALYKRNDINVFDFASVAQTLAQRYNNAAVICENNGTGLGGILLNELYMEKGYENIYYDYENQTLGVNANAQTKPLATTNFKEDIESNVCKIYANSILVELRIYEEGNKPGKFAAKRGNGNMDDQVSASYWVSYLLRTKWWDDNKNDFYSRIVVQQTVRVEEAQAEEELNNFKRLFNDESVTSPEQDMENFERELMSED